VLETGGITPSGGLKSNFFCDFSSKKFVESEKVLTFAIRA